MPTKNITSKKELKSKNDIHEYNTSTYKLYGMTLEQYLQGQAIHSKCFDQLKEIKLHNL